MKLLTGLLISSAILFSAIACSSAKTAEESKGFPLGDYQYTGLDNNGQKIVIGTLRIKTSNEKQITGDWELKRIAGTGPIGDQDGKGELMGSYLEGKIHIDLNPNMSDANVYLVGTIENGRYHGTWSFNAYDGPRATGTFEAVKK